MMPGRRRASMVLPAPGGPDMRTLWAPATATSRARFTCSWPMMSAKSASAAGDLPRSAVRSAGGAAAPPPAASCATASASVRAGYTSRPSTSAASAAFAAGRMQPAHPAPPQALGEGQRAGHGPQRAVQAELADRGQRPAAVAAVGGLAGGHQKGQGDGQVERGALLAQVGRRQVDGDAPRRELVGGVDDRRAHALAALLDGGVGQADDAEGRGRGDDVGLDLDGLPSRPLRASLAMLASKPPDT